MRIFFCWIFFVVISTVSLIQCKSGKAITKAIAPKDTTIAVTTKSLDDSLLLIQNTKDNFKKSKINFSTFSAKIKLDIEANSGKQYDLVANVRILKDSAIWVSISATLINIEVFRVLITRDSVILLNKREKEINYRSIDYLQELTNIPFDFTTIQDLLIGNPIFLNENNFTVKKNETMVLISSVGNNFKNLLTILATDNLLQQCKLDDLDVTQNRTANFTFEDYENKQGVLFSTKRQILVAEKSKLDIRMKYKQYEFNKELSVSFPIPKKYKKK